MTMEKQIDRDTAKAVDALVRRVAFKAGYEDSSNLTYKEHLQRKYDQKMKKIKAKQRKYKHRLSLTASSVDTDFSEEIRSYLVDGIADLMEQGYSQEEALAATLDKFDNAETEPSFDSFVQAFDGFGIGEMDSDMWYSRHGQAIGLFYAAFVLLGLVIGSLVGLAVFSLSWMVLVGTAAGFLIGVACALLVQAVMLVQCSGKEESR